MVDAFEQLVIRHLAGELDETGCAELNDMLAADAGRRAMFVTMCTQARLIAVQWRVQERVQGSGFRVQERKSALRTPQFALGLAALIALAVTAWFIVQPEPRTPNPEPSIATQSVAMLTASDNAVFAESMPPTRLGADLTTDVISLLSGSAQVMYHSGAVVDLTGPCEFVMTGLNRGRLLRGTLEAYVPQRAAGFTVQAPGQTRIVDLGTRFYVTTEPGAVNRIGVIEGRVQVITNSQSRVLTAGSVVRVAASHIEPQTMTADQQWAFYLRSSVLGGSQAFAYYPLDGSAAAQLGPGGSIVGQVAGAPDRYGQPGGAMRFSGNGYIDIGAAWPDGEYTVSAWVKPDAFVTGDMTYIVGVQNSGSNPGRFLRLLADGRPDSMFMTGLQPHNQKTQVTAEPAEAGRWILITATYRSTGAMAGELKLYVDGRLADASTTRGDAFAADEMANLKIGTRPDRPGEFRFHGLIDDVLILRRALDEQEVAALHRAGWAPEPSSTSTSETMKVEPEPKETVK